MDRKDWKEKEKQFLDMLKKADENKSNVNKQIEELETFLETVRAKIKTFK